MTAEIEIFDRALLRRHRDRAARMPAESRFLLRHVEADIMDRLGFVQRTFSRALIVGAADSELPAMLTARNIAVECCDSGPVFAGRKGGIPCLDPDRLDKLEAGYDLLVVPGGLDLVNDLPGMLVQCRRLMAPDSLFLAVLAGAGSLPLTRHIMQQAEQASGSGASPRLHPQIDVRAAGDLLTRAGFVQPVADSHGLTISYDSFRALISDLRAHAATNALVRRNRAPVSKAAYDAARDSFAALADAHGRTQEHVEILTMTGWTPPAGLDS